MNSTLQDAWGTRECSKQNPLGMNTLTLKYANMGFPYLPLQLLTDTVFLESISWLSICECRVSSIFDAYYARLCWSAALHGQEELSGTYTYRSIPFPRRYPECRSHASQKE